MAEPGSQSKNRLARETSPYLLQHADNPVDWYPWGEEAFAKARDEDKPILLSIGYSACHWCHVMAHESFADQATADLMNEGFVSVKVDREERPDVDAVYMSAVQAMTGSGGWPMTVALTPSGEPFYGGTYFPPEDRFGRPGFKTVLAGLADAWKNRREEVLASAADLSRHLRQLGDVHGEGELGPGILDSALTALSAQFDPRRGGFGGAPKFPPHLALTFLLRRPEATARTMAEKTLAAMSEGGIYDQLGGGFARYSVDESWQVPHFEKMLYDNAQLARNYLEAYSRTSRPHYRRVARQTLDWAAREMRSPGGGFYSAIDADSEGEEGRFYVWDASEFDALLGEDAPFAKAAYGVTSPGDFEGRNILRRARDSAGLAESFGLEGPEAESKLETVRERLLEARGNRVRPGTDHKVLVSWNGLMLAAFADGGRILERQDYLDIARQNALFIRNELWRGGRLWHTYSRGQARVPGLIEDYALYGLGLVALYRASFESGWLLWALELAQAAIGLFRDESGAGFFSTPKGGEELIVRPKDYFDSGLPSGNGAMAQLLVELARYTGDRDWEDLAAGAIRPMAEAMAKQPTGFGSMLCALQHLLAPPREIAVFGEPDAADTRALLEVIAKRALPFAAVALSGREDDPLAEHLPFLRGRSRVRGEATAYVCEGGACRLPVTKPGDLAEQLTAAAG